MTWTGHADDGGTVTVLPASRASWEDVCAVFGERGEASRCRCQWFRHRAKDLARLSVPERTALQREQLGGDDPARGTSGLIAYAEGEPVGWCAVEPRTAYVRLLRMPLPWAERDEDPADDGVWSITCFVTRVGHRRRGISRVLAAAAADHAREQGARAVEGYPMIVTPDRALMWGELFVGNRTVFADAGFTEVARRGRRVVMRLEPAAGAG